MCTNLLGILKITTSRDTKRRQKFVTLHRFFLNFLNGDVYFEVPLKHALVKRTVNQMERNSKRQQKIKRIAILVQNRNFQSIRVPL